MDRRARLPYLNRTSHLPAPPPLPHLYLNRFLLSWQIQGDKHSRSFHITPHMGFSSLIYDHRERGNSLSKIAHDARGIWLIDF